MGWLHRFFFGVWLGKDGRPLLFTRAGMAAVVVLTFSLMCALAFAEELGHGRPFATKFCVALGIAVLMLLLVEKKRLALGVALAIMAFRLTFGLVFVARTLTMLLCAVTCWSLTWALLRNAS